jgi:hypothetical protein
MQLKCCNIQMQDVEIEEKVDVIISEWMGYMLLYEVLYIFCLYNWTYPTHHLTSVLYVKFEI